MPTAILGDDYEFPGERRILVAAYILLKFGSGNFHRQTCKSYGDLFVISPSSSSFGI